MTTKTMGTIITGAALTAGVAYMATAQNRKQTQMKKFRKNTANVMKNVGSVINDISKVIS